MRFQNRIKAGRALAEKLQLETLVDPVVLALPRGGVVVAAAIAEALRAPLEVLVVRKLDAPRDTGAAFGALAEGGATHLDGDALRQLGLSDAELDAVVHDAEQEIERRVRLYRRGRPAPELHGRTAVIVDDGIVSGNSALAAVAAARAGGASRVVLAVPVLPEDAVGAFMLQVDDLVYLKAPERFVALGAWYEDFPMVTDEQVMAALDRAHARRAGLVEAQELAIPLEVDAIGAELAVPPNPRGLVIFAHGSGSSRHSPRNAFIARRLQATGFATLLVDLLTEREEAEDVVTGRLRFGIELLAHRLAVATAWARRQDKLAGLPLGYFGASTGAAAALVAAAREAEDVRAVVSRGGRPDLAGEEVLAAVRAPTLFVVGDRDLDVLVLTRKARAQMHGLASLELVQGATHLFEEPGALAAVADLAASWFDRYLHAPARRAEAPAHP